MIKDRTGTLYYMICIEVVYPDSSRNYDADGMNIILTDPMSTLYLWRCYGERSALSRYLKKIMNVIDQTVKTRNFYNPFKKTRKRKYVQRFYSETPPLQL